MTGMTSSRIVARQALARWSAAAALALALSQSAFAFSQIGTKDGAAPQREGIVSVPLPPLAGSSSPAETPAASEPQTQPGAPATTTPAEPVLPAAGTPGTMTEPSAVPESTPGDEDVPAENATPPVPDPAVEGAVPTGDIPPGAVAGPEEDAGPPPAIVHGDDGLPQAVRDLRAKLIEIAKAGDIEALRPYIQVGEEGTLLSFGGAEGDPIAYLKTTSGDGEGVEILAILLEVLEAGHVRNEPDSENEIFVWPYFTSVAIDKLTKPQKVELFELVTAGDYQEMLGFGAYNFYRVGISPDGKLQFFVAGD